MTNIEAASSSSFSRSWKFHVFVSFRGKDTRYNFISHLHQALLQREIRTFLDYDLRRGEELSAGLIRAIEESKIFIIVFSKDYGSSKWCLDELVKILECKKTNQQTMIPVFYKVTPSDVKKVNGRFGKTFSSLQRRYRDEKEKVDKWRAALSEAANVSGHHLLDDHSEAELIRNIVEEISIRVIDRTYLHLAKYPVGIQTRVQHVNNLLDLGKEDVRMIGIWGIGGIGKTTIAKAVYNSNAHKFEYRCFLADVRERADSGLAKLQRTLLFEIVGGKKFKVDNVHIGVTMIKEMLSGKKILLVLDDVDDSKQLDKLAGGCDWFGKGSRIVITARDKKLLTAHKINSIYNVKRLGYKAALELFSWNAFDDNEPLVDYVKLTNRAVKCAGGVPLVLSILGSKLYGESIDKWEGALDGLIKSRDLHQIFKICYDALDDPVKEVFLDIACFFKGKNINYVLERLEGRDLNPSYGIEVLVQKALVSIEENCVCMHDLLEEMGKQVVHQESPHEPGNRSRLWFYKDVRHVLTENTGTEKVRGIIVNLPEEVDEKCWNVKTFSKMTNLEIFINYNAHLSGDINYLPNKLKVLEWYSCPLQSFPARFQSEELVVFNMPSNRIIQLEESLKVFTKLTTLNVSESQFLTKIPDLSSTPNLRNLYANLKYWSLLAAVVLRSFQKKLA